VLSALGLNPGLRLGQLDEKVWVDLGVEAASVLAHEVVRCLRTQWSMVERLETPVSFDGRVAADLELSNRTRNGLLRHGRPGVMPLRDTTLGELAQIPQFGAQCLLDILSATEDGSSASRLAGAKADGIFLTAAKPSRALTRAARSLARKRWSGRVFRNDPRLGSLIRGLDDEAATARDAAECAVRGQRSPAEVRRLVAAIKALTAEGDRLRRLPLEEELTGIVGAVLGSRASREIAMARLGLGGMPPVTLDAAGRSAGVSRERVRQIETSFRDAIAPAGEVWSPALDRVLAVVDRMSPTSMDKLHAELTEHGLIRDSFSIQSTLAAANVLGRQIEIDMAHGLVSSRPLAVTPTQIRSMARRLVTHWGATTVDEVCAQLGEEEPVAVPPNLVKLVLESHEAFRWLDEQRGWFWLRDTSRNRLLNQVEKIMAVAGSLPITDLRDGVGRFYRMKGFRPPREVLARLCQDSDRYERRDDWIVGKPGLPDWKDILGKCEATLVDVLFEFGPVMRRDDLEEIVVDERGLNRSSFYVYLGYSPVIARYAPGVYGLRGAQVTAAEVDVMIPSRARTQVLQDHGWTSKHELWIAYRISAAAERSGVLAVPKAVKGVAQGSFELTTEDGRAIGTLVIEENMWGLSPFYRRYGIEEGDYVVLVLDLRLRTATAFAGAQELLLRFQAGE
jgi:hypothetical protein